jgi:PleD family two-component response regulator
MAKDAERYAYARSTQADVTIRQGIKRKDVLKTALVVEDSGSSRDITSHFLRQGGFQVLEAADGADALAVMQHRHVDLVLTDIMMPNMDGWALYRAVRADRRYNLTPFVFLTVLDELESQVHGLSLGVDDYITKPVTPAQLLARVNTALQRSERLSRYFYRDPVTDLETASYLRQRLVIETERCRSCERPLTLVSLGIGNYISLVRGHAEWFAREATTAAGTALRERLRPFDLIAHMGAGRFAVLMPEAEEGHARAWAEEMQAGWKLSLVWPETEQRIGIDIGFAVDTLAPGDADPLSLLERRLESFARKW